MMKMLFILILEDIVEGCSDKFLLDKIEQSKLRQRIVINLVYNMILYQANGFNSRNESFSPDVSPYYKKQYLNLR